MDIWIVCSLIVKNIGVGNTFVPVFWDRLYYIICKVPKMTCALDDKLTSKGVSIVLLVLLSPVASVNFFSSHPVKDYVRGKAEMQLICKEWEKVFLDVVL